MACCASQTGKGRFEREYLSLSRAKTPANLEARLAPGSPCQARDLLVAASEAQIRGARWPTRLYNRTARCHTDSNRLYRDWQPSASVHCGSTRPEKEVNDLIYTVDPLKDERWGKLLEKSPRSSIFHSRAWLEALKRTYNYVPIAFTTSPPDQELSNGLVCCIVRSWLVAPRLVSVPFSDHVDPLIEREEELAAILGHLRDLQQNHTWKSVELRPARGEARFFHANSFSDGQHYVLHRVSLEARLEDVYARFHRDSIQRRIRRAEREHLNYEEGCSDRMLAEFYRLHVRTRRRQGLPPPPKKWFTNLLSCLKKQARLRMLSKDDRVIAAIFTLRHKDTLVYKYGCSDERFHNLGGMPLLLWRAIEEAKRSGARELDLGRSDLNNPGLITFKEKFGATKSDLVYKVVPGSPEVVRKADWRLQMAKGIFRQLPESAFVLAGRLLYPHIG